MEEFAADRREDLCRLTVRVGDHYGCPGVAAGADFREERDLAEEGGVEAFRRRDTAPRAEERVALAGGISDVWPQGLLVLALLGATTVALVRAPRVGVAAAAFFIVQDALSGKPLLTGAEN